MIHFIQSYFAQGNERSIRAKKNILASLVIRVCSMGIGLAMVPMILHAISPAEYGVWLTVSSFIGWFSFFDIGLGNGLRNKFAEAMAKNESSLAREYISTTYAIMLVIAAVMCVVFSIVNAFVDWGVIFNAAPAIAEEITKLMPVIFLLFAVQFVLQLLSSILLADQRPALSNLLGLSGSILTLAGIVAMDMYDSASLYMFGLVFTAAPVVVLFGAHTLLFRGRYRQFAPSFAYVNIAHAKLLANIGIQFFIIQIAVLVLFSTSNMIIVHYFGPEDVTAYNIALKYFGLVSSLFVLVANPFWSAITDAYHRNELQWIRSSIKKLIFAWAGLLSISFLMLLASPFVYPMWIGTSVYVPFSVSLAMFVFIVLTNWNSIFATFLNGTGKIRLQLYSAIVVSVINIPLSIYLLGIFELPGVILSTIICVGIGSVWAPIQYSKIMNNTASGIWAK